MRILNNHRLLTTLAFAVVMAACAKIVAPTGGPKDTHPPVMVHSTPTLKSLNFKGREVVITFNKFIQPLKDANNQVIVSPPTEKQPDMRLKGKSIIIKFKEDLKPNSTYNIYFGDAILDLNEGNIKKNFYFTFSTGEQIDTLELRGNITNAESGLPEKDIFVELYTSMQDSVPIKEKPYYIGKTNSWGDFTIKYVGNKLYRLFALKDANSNLKYDLPTEAIAFESEAVKPDPPLPDSTDSLKRMNTPIYHRLALFTESDSVQRIDKKSVTDRKKFTLQFRYGVKKLEMQPLNFKMDNWNFNEWNRKRDTLNCWFTQPMQDTLQLAVKADNMKPDTVQFILKSEKQRNVKQTQKKETPKEKVELRATSFEGTTQPFDKPLLFESLTPVMENKLSDLRLIRGKDTTRVTAVWADSISHRRFIINQQWKEKSSYSILIPSGRLKDLFGAVNDSINIQFNTWEERDYGSIILDTKLTTTRGQWIVQLMNEKDLVLRAIPVNKSGEVAFRLLPPGKYLIKAFWDENGNGIWDTGSYLKHRQPERVVRFPKVFDVRAYWEIKEVLDLK